MIWYKCGGDSKDCDEKSTSTRRPKDYWKIWSVLPKLWYRCGIFGNDLQGCDKILGATERTNEYWKAWWVLPGLSSRASDNHDFEYSTECLQPGRYLAEFYLNGKPPLRIPVDLGGTGLKALNLRTINISICYPGTWKPWQPSRELNAGTSLVEGYTSEDGGEGRPSRGEFLFKYYYPIADGASDPAILDAQNSAISKAKDFLVSEKFISQFQLSQMKNDGCNNLPREENILRASVEHNEELLLLKVWTHKDGVYVAVVFHRLRDDNEEQNRFSITADQDDCNILGSVSNMY